MLRKKQALSTKPHDNKGSMLSISYLLITAFIMLGAAFIVMSINGSRTTERQKRTTLVFHIAEAGIERILYDLRQDYVNDLTNPSWMDGNINGFAIGPNTTNFYNVGYGSTSINGGSYTVQLRNVSGSADAIWARSTGTLGDVQQTIEVYAKIINVSPWNNAIFAGRGSAGTMINGNSNVYGSVHILGTGLQATDFAINLGGTPVIVGNNYSNLPAALRAKVPALPTTVVNGETVETLNAVLRVKRGIVGLNGSGTVGRANAMGNAYKETVDGTYVTNGYGGNQGTNNVYSDNGVNNAYDLANVSSFPSLSDPYGGYSSYQQYIRANSLVITNPADLATLANIRPNSNFSFSSPQGSIQMDGNGNLTISGMVYIANGGSLNTSKIGNNKTISYTGSGSILAEGNVQIDTDLVTNGNNSFPANALGIMTPNGIGFNEADIDVMGLFYAEGTVTVQKQTNIVGSIVSNYFNMSTNIPSIYQVPDIINSMPAGIISRNPSFFMKIISWRKL